MTNPTHPLLLLCWLPQLPIAGGGKCSDRGQSGIEHLRFPASEWNAFHVTRHMNTREISIRGLFVLKMYTNTWVTMLSVTLNVYKTVVPVERLHFSKPPPSFLVDPNLPWDLTTLRPETHLSSHGLLRSGSRAHPRGTTPLSNILSWFKSIYLLLSNKTSNCYSYTILSKAAYVTSTES